MRMHELVGRAKVLSVFVSFLAACGPAPAEPEPIESSTSGAEGSPHEEAMAEGAGAGADATADVAASADASADASTDTGADTSTDTGAAATADATAPAEAPPPACVVSGRATVRDLSFTVEGERRPRRFVSVTGVFDATLPERANRPTRIAVREPIVLQAETRAAIPYAIARPLDAAAGAVHLAQATPLTRVVPDGADVRVDVDLADGVSVADLALPCGALVLHATAPATPPAPAEEGLLSRGGQLRIFSAPDAADPAVVIRLRRPTEVVLTETARQSGWVRVWRSFDTGASFAGWVPESAVRPLATPPRPRAIAERVVRERVPPPCEPPAAAGFYLGPARVAAGTEVRAAPDGVVWTRTVARDLTVRTLESQDWVALVEVPGLEPGGRCPTHLEAAFIPRASVTFPSATRLPGGMTE
jgi:hypothetical protein